jgi:hypothetical protein
MELLLRFSNASFVRSPEHIRMGARRNPVGGLSDSKTHQFIWGWVSLTRKPPDASGNARQTQKTRREGRVKTHFLTFPNL